MRRFVLCGVLLLLVAGLLGFPLAPARAQNVAWVRQFGSADHDGATSVAVDPAGGIYVAGWTDGALPGAGAAGGLRDAFVRKYDRDGNESWSRQLGTPRADVAMDVAVGPAGEVHLVGQTGGALGGQTQAGEFDAFVRKYGPDGAESWTRQFGGSRASAAAGVTVETGGNIYLAGWVYDALPGQQAAGQYDAFLRKYNANGAEAWTRQFGTKDHDRASHPTLDATGEVEVAASSARGNTARGSAARRYGPGGAEVESRDLQTTETEDLRGMALDPAGNIYVAGQTDTDHGHAFVRKYNRDGTALWTRELPHAGAELVAVDVAVAPSGDIYVASYGGDRDSNIFVHKYNRNGAEVWTEEISTSDTDVASRLVVDQAGNVYLVGWTAGTFSDQRSAGLSDAFLASLR